LSEKFTKGTAREQVAKIGETRGHGQWVSNQVAEHALQLEQPVQLDIRDVTNPYFN